MYSFRTIRPKMIYAIVAPLPKLLWSIPLFWLLYKFQEQFPDLPKYGVWFILATYLYKILLIRSRKFTVLRDQMVYQRGIFSTSTDYYELYRIRDYKAKKPFHLKLIGAMNVTIITSDRFNNVVEMRGIPSTFNLFSLRNMVKQSGGLNGLYEVD